MNALPRVLSHALQIDWPSPGRRVLPVALALLVASGLLLPATAVRAQSDALEGFPVFDGTPIDSPAADADLDSNAKKAPSFSIQSIRFDLPGEHTTGATTLTTVSKNGYAGTVDLTCTLETKTTTPTPPLCAMYPASVALVARGQAEPQILIFGKGTKLPPGVSIGSNARWIGGGAALACCLLFGIPARRRAWRSVVSAALLLVALGSFAACSDTPKIITHGYYVFKVTGKDSVNPKITSSSVVDVSVL